ncbi:MAG: PQQ-dependent sugar dehydrogenase [Verrucomicrobia bacterium]|nr:PQQ-dependent sugar dehydrogenase [Verrucomicrobiota bacterium]
MNIRQLLLGAALAAVASVLTAAPTFTVPGFVDEEVYRGNGMITARFDAAGRMWVTEKQGRILRFTPNSDTTPIAYQYYETATAWTAIPNFDALAPVASGTVTSFTLTPRLRDDNFGFRFTGQITLPTAGTYTFYLASDDGSRLFIDGALVVNHDGTHGATEKSGSVVLAAGTHAIKVEYFEAGGGQSLLVQMEGPGQPKAPINKGPFLNPTVFADLVAQVNTDGERGLLGLALDPDFANNRFLYVLYSTPTDQRISRLTASVDFTTAVPGSETILLGGLPNANNVHKAGDIAFHPSDPHNLYVMIGDDGNRNLVSDLGLYNGKILKLSAADGRGLPGNPYYDNNDATTVRSRVWSHRYRNPFRFAFDPAAPIPDVLYISENGDGTDRTARIARAADGGWDNAFLTDSADGQRRILATSGPSRVGIAILRGGPFAPDGGPILYNARFNTSTGLGELTRGRLTGANLDTLTPLPEDNGGIFYTGFTGYILASLQPGPDGALYYTDSGQGASTGGGNRLGRLRFVGGTAPVASFTATPATGQTPLPVTFTDTSTAPGSSLSAWSWNFGDGTTSNQQHPTHTFPQPGVYTVSLTVTNALGLTHTQSSVVTAFHQTALQLTGQILDATLGGTPLAVATELCFYRRDGVTPQPIAGGSGPQGNALAVPAGGVIEASLGLQLTGDGLVVSAGEPAADGLQAAFAGLLLSTTAPAQAATVQFRLSDTLLRGRVLDTKGHPARVDLGLSRGAAGNWQGFLGGRDFLGGTPFGSSGMPHRLVPDVLGFYHIPLAPGVGGATFHLDTTADTLTATHGRVRRAVFVPAGEAVVQNLVLGLYDGGVGETDLSGIAPTPNVTLATHIQPQIFTVSCQACHNDIATNSGGLDLQSGAAFAALVNHESAEAPGVLLVEPGAPGRSYLLEKVNATLPQVGTSMRPGDPMLLSQRALLRDWIQQLPVSGRLQFASGNYAVGEAGATVQAAISVERALGASGAISVNVSTVAGGTAVAGSDYTPISVTLNWADGDSTAKTAFVPILSDGLAEGSKTVLLQLSGPTGNALLGAMTGATLTIADRPFEAWRLARFGAQANAPEAGPNADFDGDGLANLVEYALDSDPTRATPAPTVGLDGAGRTTLAFARNQAATGLVLTVEASSDLAAAVWQPLATKTGPAGWVVQPGASVSEANGSVLVTDAVGATSQPRRFLRLRVARGAD